MLNKDFSLRMFDLDVRLVEVFDAEFIVKLRCDKDRTQFMKMIDNNIQNQREWIKKYKEREFEGTDYYFIYSLNGADIGVNRISYIDYTSKTCKSSSWIKIPSERSISMQMFFIHKYILFEILEMKSFISDIHMNNTKSLSYYKDFGFPLPECSNVRGYLDISVSREYYLSNKNIVLDKYNLFV